MLPVLIPSMLLVTVPFLLQSCMDQSNFWLKSHEVLVRASEWVHISQPERKDGRGLSRLPALAGAFVHPWGTSASSVLQCTQYLQILWIAFNQLVNMLKLDWQEGCGMKATVKNVAA